jgi:dihydrofolate reductase
MSARAFSDGSSKQSLSISRSGARRAEALHNPAWQPGDKTVTTGHVFIATSLDGFIARQDGSLDWLEAAQASGEDHGFAAFIDDIDAICMGRETFATVAGFQPWPYTKPVIVLSAQLQQQTIPEHLRDTISIARSAAEALTECRRNGWCRVYIDGGVTIRSFLALGAIRDLVITRLPILLGTGLPLFGPLPADVALRHVATRTFPSGLVQSRYEVC